MAWWASGETTSGVPSVLVNLRSIATLYVSGKAWQVVLDRLDESAILRSMSNNYLRPLRANVFQVIIGERVAAVLHVSAITKIFVDAGDTPRLLATIQHFDELQDVGRRIAEGEFDDDFRFNISDASDEDGNYWLEQIATPSQTPLYSSLMRDPYGFVAAERQCQAERAEFPDLADRFDHYAEMGL